MPPQSSASSSWWESCLIDVSRLVGPDLRLHNIGPSRKTRRYFWSKTLARALLPISFVEIALRLLRTSVAVFRAVAAGVALAMVADFPRDVVRNGSMPPHHFFFQSDWWRSDFDVDR